MQKGINKGLREIENAESSKHVRHLLLKKYLNLKEKALLGDGMINNNTQNIQHSKSRQTKNKQENYKIEGINKTLREVEKEIRKVIVGQEEVINKVLIALISRGHVLLEGMPGLAKTLLISSLAKTLDCSFKRIQFTPDLLPADIIGTKIYNEKTKKFYTEKGPIFHNFILADEINRAPPKVQSALLEGMQEKQVTIQGDTFELPKPFFVMATQNPVEQEGTYPLPEAQLDRFAFKILVDYPKKEEEKEILRRYTSNEKYEANKVISIEKLIEIQKIVREVYIDETIQEYIVDIIDATRHPEDYLDGIKELIEYGASPRATIWLTLGAKAHAIIHGRDYIKPIDVKNIAKEVLMHRIILSYEAEAEEIKPQDIIERIINHITPP